MTREQGGCGSTSGYTPERDPLCALSVARVSPACPACGSTGVPTAGSIPSPARPVARASPALTTCWSTGETTPASTPSPARSVARPLPAPPACWHTATWIDRRCLGKHKILEGMCNVSGRFFSHPFLLSRDAACPAELLQHFVSFFLIQHLHFLVIKLFWLTITAPSPKPPLL